MTVDIDTLALQVLAASRFVATPPHVIRVNRASEETIRWEVFLGHLLDPAATRRTETFDSWHVFLDRTDAQVETPLLTVYWSRATETAFVTRQILTHAFEAYEESPGVISTRPVEKWVRELIGTIPARELQLSNFGPQLAQLIYLAVVGISRLPITSLESPLPCFSLGELSYFPVESEDFPPNAPARDRLCGLLTLTDGNLAGRALEFALRGLPASDDEAIVAALGEAGPERADLLLRRVFNQAALAPHTGFANRLVGLVERLAAERWFGTQRVLQLYSFMLRQLCRHLTAFDLTLFHNFGANYPDALLLDTLLKATLRVVDQAPERALHSDQTMLRRALRSGAILRKHYEGLRVPDAPTSMGENARVLPAPFTRVPEEQITEHGKRRRVLFADDPTDALFGPRTRPILEQSFRDLSDERELQELGTALFLDRPLGALKQRGEVDRTPLISYEAFSRLVADRRLATAKSARWIDVDRHQALRSQLARVAPAGLVAAELQCIERPGVVSLADANKAAADFVILRSTRGSLAEFLKRYDWQPLAARFPAIHEWLLEGADVLFIQQLDAQSAPLPRFELFRGSEIQFALSAKPTRSTMARYREHSGIETLTPLKLIQIRDTGRLIDVSESEILIQAR